MRNINSINRGNALAKIDATHNQPLLALPDKGRAIKGLVSYNIWDLQSLDLLDGLALGCYQPSPEV